MQLFLNTREDYYEVPGPKDSAAVSHIAGLSVFSLQTSTYPCIVLGYMLNYKTEIGQNRLRVL